MITIKYGDEFGIGMPKRIVEISGFGMGSIGAAYVLDLKVRGQFFFWDAQAGIKVRLENLL